METAGKSAVREASRSSCTSSSIYSDSDASADYTHRRRRGRKNYSRSSSSKSSQSRNSPKGRKVSRHRSSSEESRKKGAWRHDKHDKHKRDIGQRNRSYRDQRSRTPPRKNRRSRSASSDRWDSRNRNGGHRQNRNDHGPKYRDRRVSQDSEEFNESMIKQGGQRGRAERLNHHRSRAGGDRRQTTNTRYRSDRTLDGHDDRTKNQYRRGRKDQGVYGDTGSALFKPMGQMHGWEDSDYEEQNKKLLKQSGVNENVQKPQPVVEVIQERVVPEPTKDYDTEMKAKSKYKRFEASSEDSRDRNREPNPVRIHKQQSSEAGQNKWFHDKHTFEEDGQSSESDRNQRGPPKPYRKGLKSERW